MPLPAISRVSARRSHFAPGTSRMERIKTRAKSGEPMQACVKSGYIIGRDDPTKAKSDAHFLGFLRREFRM